MAFDFSPIGGVASDLFDSDKIDIGRMEVITLPDGDVTVTSPDIPRQRDVACHLSFSDIPNPDTAAVGVIPIIHALHINCPVGIDLQNADRIWAYKCAADGKVLETYEGNIGAPIVNQSRQEATMAVRQGG